VQVQEEDISDPKKNVSGLPIGAADMAATTRFFLNHIIGCNTKMKTKQQSTKTHSQSTLISIPFWQV
jgi:hypothetical protein